MNDFIIRCEKYGADINTAIDRFMGDEELYETCIKIFVADSNFIGLKKSIDAQNYTEAFEHAHALKGVSANLSLTPLYDKICVVVEALRADQYDYLDAQFCDIETSLNDLKNIL